MRSRREAKRFVAGAVGEPGRRTFLLQFETDSGVETFVAEKAQVAALSVETERLLAEAGAAGEPSDAEAGVLDETADIRFRVREIHIAYSQEDHEVILELVAADDDERVGFVMTPALLEAGTRVGSSAVAAGRPLCSRCGLAMDPEGHHCPHDNGDLRGFRP